MRNFEFYIFEDVLWDNNYKSIIMKVESCKFVILWK